MTTGRTVVELGKLWLPLWAALVTALLLLCVMLLLLLLVLQACDVFAAAAAAAGAAAVGGTEGCQIARLSYGLSRASCPAGQQNRLGQQKCSGCQPAVHFTGAFLEKYAFQIAINGARVVRPCPCLKGLTQMLMCDPGGVGNGIRRTALSDLRTSAIAQKPHTHASSLSQT